VASPYAGNTPDGAVVAGTPLLAASANGGADLTVTWDAITCASTDYNLYWGDLAGVASYTYTGSSCGLGSTGTATVAMPPGSVFFYVVGNDGAGTEGINGWDDTGAPNAATGVGLCGVTAQNAGTCP